MAWEDTLTLASFLGEQLHNLHLLPLPPCNYSKYSDVGTNLEFQYTNSSMEVDHLSDLPVEWEAFVGTLIRKKKDVSSRLSKWYAHTFHRTTSICHCYLMEIYLNCETKTISYVLSDT